MNASIKVLVAAIAIAGLGTTVLAEAQTLQGHFSRAPLPDNSTFLTPHGNVLGTERDPAIRYSVEIIRPLRQAVQPLGQY